MMRRWLGFLAGYSRAKIPPMDILQLLREPWPWWVAGPLIGLTVPLLLLLGNKAFGISSNLRHACAILPTRVSFFRYDWRRQGGWNLVYAAGIIGGGFLGGVLLANPADLHLAENTREALNQLGFTFDGAFFPAELFGSGALGSFRTVSLLVLGGAFVGFGARWAGGCTSGHAISGLSNLQLPSLVAVLGFFAGGLIMTHLLFPLIF